MLHIYSSAVSHFESFTKIVTSLNCKGVFLIMSANVLTPCIMHYVISRIGTTILMKHPYQAVCPLRMENLGNCSHFKVSRKYLYNLRMLAVRAKSMVYSAYPYTIIMVFICMRDCKSK